MREEKRVSPRYPAGFGLSVYYSDQQNESSTPSIYRAKTSNLSLNGMALEFDPAQAWPEVKPNQTLLVSMPVGNVDCLARGYSSGSKNVLLKARVAWVNNNTCGIELVSKSGERLDEYQRLIGGLEFLYSSFGPVWKSEQAA